MYANTTCTKKKLKFLISIILQYVERAQKIGNKQYRKWRQLLKENLTIECVRNGCSFTADSMASMSNHFSTCVLIDGETFYCNRCEFGPDTRVVIEEHIKASHSLGVIESIDDKDFSDSDDEAEVGEESSESDGESGDDESLEKDEEGYDDYDDEDDDGWNTKGYKKKRLRDWPHNEVMLNSCLDRKGNLFNGVDFTFEITMSFCCICGCSVSRACSTSQIVFRWLVLSASFGMDTRFV